MLVKDIPRCLETYLQLFPQGSGFRTSYSRAWHPNRSSDDPIDELGATTGIYIYSAPGDPDWDLKMSENDNSIWYIGKSRGSVRARVWQNLGRLYEKDGSVCDPRFKYHRWANDSTVRDVATKDAVAKGDFVAYSVSITPLAHCFEPQVVETFLLSCFYRSTGTLPILNSLISQFKFRR